MSQKCSYLLSLFLAGFMVLTNCILPAGSGWGLYRTALAQEDGTSAENTDAGTTEAENSATEEPATDAAPVGKGPITIGSRDFTEQLVLGQLMAVALESAGFEVIDKTGLGGNNSAHDAIKAEEVDIIWDYIGTILSESHGVPPIGLPTDLDTAFQMVSALDARHHDLLWLMPTPFNDTYTLMVEPTALAVKTDTLIRSIDDLADYMVENGSSLTICVENEFYSRNDGLFSLQDHYGFTFAEEDIQIVAYDQLYEGLRDGLCDVAEGFSTDGRISAWGFQNLADSSSFFPAYNASPIVRAGVISAYPEIIDILNQISRLLDNETIAALNAQVDIGADGLQASGDEELVREVAVRFLQDNDLIAKEKKDGPIVKVGSRDFTEQLILGQMIVIILEDAGYQVIDETGLGGTNSAHNALKAGDVDIIWDYIGTILSESHGIPPIGLPAETQTAYEMVRGLDSHHHDLIWLTPTVFNDTYTMMIKPDALAEKIGFSFGSINDLADYMNANDAPLTICVENEFYARGDGLYSLQDHYGFAFAEEKIEIVAYDQLYEGLRDGLCDVAEGFSTDGRISSWGFQNLADTELFFPAYNASPIIRRELLADHPEIGDMLDQLGPILDNGIIAALNARVDIGADGLRGSGDEESVRDVTYSFLQENRLIALPEIVVGSRDFTEQLLLGQILIGALETAGFNAVDKTGLGGTNSAHDALKAGEVDIIWDYIGTILSESHGVPAIGLPSDTQTALKMVQGLDSHHHNLTWLEPSAFNDTYTLMIKPDTLSGKIGQSLESIEDLATYMNGNNSPLTVCVENEFYTRGDGLYSLQDHYGFAFAEENIQIVAYDQLYEGLRGSSCDVAEGFSTDGRISAWGFQNLEDSLNFFPAYNASPIIRDELLAAHPIIGDLLNQLAEVLDNDTIAALNARVDIGADGERGSGDEESVEAVARSFLSQVLPDPVPVAANDNTTDTTSTDTTSTDATSTNIATNAADSADNAAAAEDMTEAASEEVASEEVASEEVASEEVASEELASQEVTSEEAASEAITIDSAEADTTEVESAEAEPVGDEASDTDSTDTGASEAEAADTDSTDTDSTDTGSTDTDSTDTDSTDTDSTDTEAPEADSTDTEAPEAEAASLGATETEAAEETASEAEVTEEPASEETATEAEVTEETASEAETTEETATEAVTAEEAATEVEATEETEVTEEPASETEASESTDAEEASSDQGFLNEQFLKQEFVVASTNEPPQILLGHMVAALLQDLGIPVVEDMGRGSSAQLRIALNNREVDLYTDLSLDALTTVHQLPESVLPTNMGELFELVNNLDQEDSIVWFTPLVVGENFPSATVTRLEILEAAPGLAGYMGILSSIVTKEVMDDLIDQVELGPDGVSDNGDELSHPEAVQNFLCGQAIITDCEATTNAEASDESETNQSTAPLSQVQIVFLPTGTPDPAAATESSIPASNSAPVVATTSAPAETATDSPTPQQTPTLTRQPTSTATSSQSNVPVTVAAATRVAEQVSIPPGPYIAIPVEHRVNARATTSIDAPVTQVLERSQTYKAVGRTFDSLWIQVEIDEETAWAFTEAVFYSSAMLEELPVVTPPSLNSVRN